MRILVVTLALLCILGAEAAQAGSKPSAASGQNRAAAAGAHHRR
jgi:hypothetical protein